MRRDATSHGGRRRAVGVAHRNPYVRGGRLRPAASTGTRCGNRQGEQPPRILRGVPLVPAHTTAGRNPHGGTDSEVFRSVQGFYARTGIFASSVGRAFGSSRGF